MTTAPSTATAAQLQALLGDQAPTVIRACDAESIKEHGREGLLRQALQRIVTNPTSRPLLVAVGWMDRPKKALHILESNREYWGLPDAVEPNTRTIRLVREVLNMNELGNPKLY